MANPALKRGFGVGLEITAPGTICFGSFGYEFVDVVSGPFDERQLFFVAVCSCFAANIVPDTKVCDLLRRRIVVDEEITRYN
jgi:hypothetical protein